MGKFTIMGVARAYDLDVTDPMQSIADMFEYWLDCNNNDMDGVNVFNSLRKEEQKKFVLYLLDERHYNPRQKKLIRRLIKHQK